MRPFIDGSSFIKRQARQVGRHDLTQGCGTRRCMPGHLRLWLRFRDSSVLALGRAVSEERLCRVFYLAAHDDFPLARERCIEKDQIKKAPWLQV